MSWGPLSSHQDVFYERVTAMYTQAIASRAGKHDVIGTNRGGSPSKLWIDVHSELHRMEEYDVFNT